MPDNWVVKYGWDGSKRPKSLRVAITPRLYALIARDRKKAIGQLKESIAAFIGELDVYASQK